MVDFKEFYYSNYFNKCAIGFNIRTIIFPYKDIMDLTDNSNNNIKLFADSSSIFSKICDPLETANVLNINLTKIREWSQQWKIDFNPDPTNSESNFFLENHIPRSILIYTLIVL